MYTYDSTRTLNGRTVYQNVRYQGVLCQIITSFNPAIANFTELINVSGTIYPFDSTTEAYLTNENTVIQWDDDGWKSRGSASVTSQTPSDYLTNIRSGNYTLEVYS